MESKSIQITIYENGDDEVLIDGKKVEATESKGPDVPPWKDLGDVKSLDFIVIYETNPRCVWRRGRWYCA